MVPACAACPSRSNGEKAPSRLSLLYTSGYNDVRIGWRIASPSRSSRMGVSGRLAVVVAVVAALCSATASMAGERVTVFAAASLKNALDAVNAACDAEAGESGDASPMRRARRSPSRSRQARRPTSSSRPTSTGWTISSDKKLIKPETEVEPARQPHRAGRAGGFARRRSTIAPGLRPRRPARRRQARHGRRQGRAGRQIRQGGAGEARRLGVGRGQGRAGRERPRRAAAGVARRGAARHRLPDRRRGRARASRSSAPSRRTPTRRSSTRSR